MSALKTVTAFAPASIGNLGVGFDMLGLAIAGAGDRVSASRTDNEGISIAEVLGPDGEIHPDLPGDAESNTASIAARALWNAHGDSDGIELRVMKGVPLQSGMGSSAASAVAAVVAVNGLLDAPLERRDLLRFALEGERFASGGLHADNVAPSLMGGLVLCPIVLLPDFVEISLPEGLRSVLVHPDLRIGTADSRGSLAREYTMDQWLAQQGFLAGFVAGCEQGDPDLIRRCLKDVVIEPQRAESVPAFAPMQESALRAGAWGCSLSGSGPSVFAIGADNDAADIGAAMEQACRDAGYECQSWISDVNAPGAELEQLC